MGKVSRSLLLQYNKCAALATRYSNILDSFWHKDDKIPLSSLKTDPKTYIVEGSDNVNLKGDGTADSPIEIYVNEVDISNKVDKVSGKGLSTNDYTTSEKEKLINLKSFKTITDGTNSFEAANAADSLTFEGVVVDPTSRKIKVSSELSIRDIGNEEKYKSNIDKRQGYFDVANKTYYPDIKVYKANTGGAVYGNGLVTAGTIIDDAFVMLSPKDAAYYSDGSGGGSGQIVHYCLKFPKVPSNYFSFELDIVGNFDGLGGNLKDYCRVKISVSSVVVNSISKISSWHGAKVEFIHNSSDIDWGFYLADDDQGNLIVATKQTSGTVRKLVHVRLNNLVLHNLTAGQQNPLDFYDGWEGFAFNSYYGYGTFRIRENFNLKAENLPLSITDKDNIAKFAITDALSFGEGFSFDVILKRISLQNTPWQILTLNSGITGTFSYKLVAGVLIVKGVSINCSAYTAESYVILGLLDIDFRPDDFKYGAVAINSAGNNNNTSVQMSPDGTVILNNMLLSINYTIYNEFTRITND